MRTFGVKICAALAACTLAVGMCGCSEQTTSSSDDNSSLSTTSRESAEEQEFETVVFGTYEQDGDETNGAEDIEWLVLDEQDGKKLLISKYVLDAAPYDDAAVGYDWSSDSSRPATDVEWADSSLRAWLNDDFINAAFSSDEQNAIATVTNSDTKNNATHTAATAADSSIHATSESQDEVFLLSVSEANSYFANKAARMAYATDYAISQGVYTGVTADPTGSEDAEAASGAVWWLRTNGYYSGYASVVVDDGYVHGAGYRMAGELHDGAEHQTYTSELGGNVGVRPCVWVDVSAL